MDDNNLNRIPTPQSLNQLPVSTFRSLYEKVLNFRPPQRASIDFIRGNLSWAIQTLELKKDPAGLRQALIKKTNRSPRQLHAVYKPGTRLIREWQGYTYEVTIMEKGYVWQNKKYRSLSRIAQEITGAKWSGPQFFGLVNHHVNSN